jgi:hypothetical protein
MTQAAITSALAAKADLAGGVLPDAQAPSISVKKDTWVVDLNDHGGVGDGVTANDAAFVSALAAINPTWGGKIVIRAGSYLISGSTSIALSNAGTILEGAGAEATKIVIGSTFSATDAISITAANCQVKDLSIVGSNTTTTSNPVAHGIIVSTTIRPKVTGCNFWYINGWAIHVIAGSGSGTNPSGGMFSKLIMRSCAGGIRFLGNTGSGSSSCFLSDIQIVACGVSTGTSANLDAIDLEDAWDILGNNIIAWMTAGTGSALHLKGNCITNSFKNMDLEGSQAAPTVLLEDGPNGFTYNFKLNGGTVQLGTIGIRVTGQAKVTSFSNLNVVNNKTHGISVEGTGNPVNIRGCYFTANGSGASGTNYDINWSGASIGFVIDPRFESAITVVGIAGVQTSIAVPALQNVRLINTSFAGVGQASTNWMTNTPNAVLDTTSGAFNYLTRVSFALGLITQGTLSTQPASLSAIVLSANTLGTATFDTFRITGDGAMAIGPGGTTGTRDTTWGRYGAAQIGTVDSDIVIALAGKGLKIKEGTNARMGTATLVASTGVTVANTSVTNNTRIFVGQHTPGGTPGAPYVATVTAGTGFTIKSTSSTDTSVVSYVLIEAAF